MSDYNKIAVSFDQAAAVRVRDGFRLIAVPLDPDKLDAWAGRCEGCLVPEDSGGRGCNLAFGADFREFRTRYPRRCMRLDRKDSRNIVWRAATCPT